MVHRWWVRKGVIPSVAIGLVRSPWRVWPSAWTRRRSAESLDQALTLAGELVAARRTLWLSGRYSAEVYAIDTRTGLLRARIPVDQGPHGLYVWPQPGRYSLGHTGILRSASSGSARSATSAGRSR